MEYFESGLSSGPIAFEITLFTFLAIRRSSGSEMLAQSLLFTILKEQVASSGAAAGTM